MGQVASDYCSALNDGLRRVTDYCSIAYRGLIKARVIFAFANAHRNNDYN